MLKLQKNQQEQILKRYKYRGAKIFVIQVGESLFQWFIVWKNELYHNFRWLDQAERVRLSKKETGGAVLIICADAEAHVDAIINKHGFFSKLKRLIIK